MRAWARAGGKGGKRSCPAEIASESRPRIARRRAVWPVARRDKRITPRQPIHMLSRRWTGAAGLFSAAAHPADDSGLLLARAKFTPPSKRPFAAYRQKLLAASLRLRFIPKHIHKQFERNPALLTDATALAHHSLSIADQTPRVDRCRSPITAPNDFLVLHSRIRPQPGPPAVV